MDKATGTKSGRQPGRLKKVSSGSSGGPVGPDREGMEVDFLGINCRSLPLSLGHPQRRMLSHSVWPGSVRVILLLVCL